MPECMVDYSLPPVKMSKVNHWRFLMEKKTPKPRSPNVQIYLYPEDAERLRSVILKENMIALKDGKPRVTKSGELEKVILKYINSKESRHSDMPMFRDK
jgi:hypothetical protein